MNVVDFFSGCGGLSYGFVQSGFDVIVGIDNNATALRTFEYNHPNSRGMLLDLSNPSFIKELEKQVGGRTVDVIVGGPPCQGYSLTGPRNKEDKRNQLFRAIFLAAKAFKPKAIIIENVPGLKTLYGGYYYQEICKEFENNGNYNYESRVLYAPNYGIPQIRKRLVFIAIRKDIGKVKFPDFIIKDEKKFITVEQAISDLPSLIDEKLLEFMTYSIVPKFDYQKKMRIGSKGIYNHTPTIHSELVKSVIRQVPEGGNYKNLPNGVGESRKFNEAWTRYHRNKPSKTIDTGHRNHFHYELDRVPTVRENARLQSFPDKFIFFGNKTEQYRQVGNAVPPLLGYAIANILKELLNNEK